MRMEEKLEEKSLSTLSLCDEIKMDVTLLRNAFQEKSHVATSAPSMLIKCSKCSLQENVKLLHNITRNLLNEEAEAESLREELLSITSCKIKELEDLRQQLRSKAEFGAKLTQQVSIWEERSSLLQKKLEETERQRNVFLTSNRTNSIFNHAVERLKGQAIKDQGNYIQALRQKELEMELNRREYEKSMAEMFQKFGDSSTSETVQILKRRLVQEKLENQRLTTIINEKSK